MKFFFIQIFCVIILIPSELPVELQKKNLQQSIAINVKQENICIPLQKVINKNEGLIFPSTSPLVFVVSYNLGDSWDLSCLRALQKNCQVLPHLQLWFNYNGFRIDNDLKHINTKLINFSNVNQRKKIFFDGCADKDLVVFLTQREDCLKVTIRDLTNKASEIETYLSEKPLSPLSLCFHNNGDFVEYSFIAKDPDNGVVGMYYRSLNHLFFKQFFTVKEKYIPFPSELSDIKKHEFIGKDTFVLLASNQLFLMGLEKSWKRQLFYSSNQSNEPREYDVISFAAYQEERTPDGQARFIVVLVKNNVERKVLLIDLLGSATQAHPIWSSCEDNAVYDRISCIGNIVTLWVDDPNNASALEIRLPINWVVEKLTSELETENLGKLLLPKIGSNYGVPLYSTQALYRFFGVFCMVGLLFYSIRYLKTNFVLSKIEKMSL
jgi:hypothetical protein